MNIELNIQDLRYIVDIHLAALSNDLLPQMGKKFLFHFYTYILQSSKESVYYHKENDRILGVCVVSNETRTLMIRVIKNLFIPFIKYSFINIITNRVFRKFVIKIIFSRSHFTPLSPDIVYIFTNSNHQGKGIGTGLIKRTEYELLRNDVHKYYVKTINKPNSAALRFYKNNNFKIEQEFMYAGTQYVYLSKTISV